MQSLTLQLPFLKYLFLSFSDSEEESRSTLLKTQYGIVIILQNRKIPTDFYLVSIWQLILLKGYIQTYQTTKVLLLSKTRQLHKENHSHKLITMFLSLVLALNNFIFNPKYHLQIKYCAMGTICAPTYDSISPSIETHLAVVRGFPTKKFLPECVNEKSSTERPS